MRLQHHKGIRPTTSVARITTMNGAPVFADNTSHCCGETHDRSNGNIDLAKYQNVCHRKHHEFCQINRHLTEKTLQIIELRKSLMRRKYLLDKRE